MYKLYVIPGSHACRSAMLMLDHKQLPYRRVEVTTLLHPLAVRFSPDGTTGSPADRWRKYGLDRAGIVSTALAALGAGSA